MEGRGIKGENASIRAVRIENLKHHAMLDAQQEAEKIKEAAGKEAFGMLIGEGQEHIEEELEKKKEEAEKKAEEKEEQEEKIEERKEEKEELQEKIEIRQEENQEVEEIKKEQRENAGEQADLIEDAHQGQSTTGTGEGLLHTL